MSSAAGWRVSEYAFRVLPRVDLVAHDSRADTLPAYVQKTKDTTVRHLRAVGRRHGARFVTFHAGIPARSFFLISVIL